MAKLSSFRFIVRYSDRVTSKPSTSGNPISGPGISHFIRNDPKIIGNPTFFSCLPRTSQRTHFPSPTRISGLFRKLDPRAKFLPSRNLQGIRYFSFKNYEMGSKDFAKNLVKNPALAVKNTLARYREAVRLQTEAFWKRNYLVVLGAGGVVLCILLWRVLFGIANTFIGFSEGMAKYGFLALSSAIVAFAYDMKLLAVDIPMASGPDQRLFMIGDEDEYRIGGGLISELRDPVVKALAAVEEFEARDEKEEEEEEDAARELQEVERRHQEELEKLGRGNSQ